MPFPSNTSIVVIVTTLACFFIFGLLNESINLGNVGILTSRPQSSTKKIQLALFTVGLGKAYVKMALNLFKSAHENVCSTQEAAFVNMTLVLVTDIPQEKVYEFAVAQGLPVAVTKKIAFISKTKQGWPRDSEIRFEAIYEYLSNHTEIDYAIWNDADHKYVAPTCFDYLGVRVATRHSHYDSAKNWRVAGFESRKEHSIR